MTNEVHEAAAEPAHMGSDATELVEDDPSAETVEESDEDAEGELPPPKRPRRSIPPAWRRVAYIVLAVLLLVSGGAAAWLYFKQYRPDQQTDFSVKQEVASTASDGTVALLSYSSDTLDQDFANAKSHLAGDFLNYYSDFTQQIVAPAAKARSLKTTAHVAGAAVTDLQPDAATVLLFIDQTTTTKDNPQPLTAVSSVLVHMNRINGTWLITKFNPV